MGKGGFSLGCKPLLVRSDGKTDISILDSKAEVSCIYKCSYCYMTNCFKRHPNMSPSYDLSQELFDKDINEYKDKLFKQIHAYFCLQDNRFIRLYNSGDFLPQHLGIIQELSEEFPEAKFYMFSKNITYPQYAYALRRLKLIDNLTINLSYDSKNILNRLYVDSKGCREIYTLDKNESIDKEFLDSFDTVLIVDKTKKALETYKNERVYHNICPSNKHLIESHHACLKCKRCI